MRVLIFAFNYNSNSPQTTLLNLYLEALKEFYIDIVINDSEGVSLDLVDNCFISRYQPTAFEKFLVTIGLINYDIGWRKQTINKLLSHQISSKNYDWIVGFSEPISCSLLALKWSRITQNSRSLIWLSDPLQSTVSLDFKNPFKRILFKYYDKLLVHNASRIIVTNPETALILNSVFPGVRVKTRVVEHIFKSPENAAYSKRRDSYSLQIAHVGHIYHTRNIVPIVSLIDSISNIISIELNLIGTIVEEQRLFAEKSASVNIVGVLDRKSAIGWVESSDYMLVIDMEDSKGMFTASKIMDAFCFGKNIIGLGHRYSALERIVLKSGGIMIYYNEEIDKNKFISYLYDNTPNFKYMQDFEMAKRKSLITNIFNDV